MILYPLKRHDGSIICEVEIYCAEIAPQGVKLGLAVSVAVAKGISLDHAILDHAHLIGASLDYASLDYASLDGASLVGASLIGASLDGARLDNASLYRASLDGARLDNASLYRASLYRATLVGASLYDADFGGNVGKVKRFVGSKRRSDGFTFHGFERESGGLGIIAGCRNFTLAQYREHIRVEYPKRANGDALAAETTRILDEMERRFIAGAQP